MYIYWQTNVCVCVQYSICCFFVLLHFIHIMRRNLVWIDVCGWYDSKRAHTHTHILLRRRWSCMSCVHILRVYCVHIYNQYLPESKTKIPYNMCWTARYPHTFLPMVVFMFVCVCGVRECCCMHCIECQYALKWPEFFNIKTHYRRLKFAPNAWICLLLLIWMLIVTVVCVSVQPEWDFFLTGDSLKFDGHYGLTSSTNSTARNFSWFFFFFARFEQQTRTRERDRKLTIAAQLGGGGGQLFC